jgi:TM2 domain-containing membrane protein YozV
MWSAPWHTHEGFHSRLTGHDNTVSAAGGHPQRSPDPGRCSTRRRDGRLRGRKKSGGVLFCFFLGGVGGHRFYLGDTGRGIAMLLTLGGLGFWALIDVFFIWNRLALVNGQRRAEIFSRYGVPLARPMY